MKLVDFGLGHPQDGRSRHTYTSRLAGDWIVFTCAACPGHTRQLNWVTGEMISRGESTATHSGIHVPGPDARH